MQIAISAAVKEVNDKSKYAPNNKKHLGIVAGACHQKQVETGTQYSYYRKERHFIRPFEIRFFYAQHPNCYANHSKSQQSAHAAHF